MYLVRIPGFVAIEQTSSSKQAHDAFQDCEVAGTELCKIDDMGNIRVIERKKHKGFVGLDVAEKNNLKRRAVELGISK